MRFWCEYVWYACINVHEYALSKYVRFFLRNYMETFIKKETEGHRKASYS
jgi:hypothetical protein